MTNVRRPRLCAYCDGPNATTRDHVFPITLYREPYPINLITVRVCEPCNLEKSQDDDFLRDILTADIYASQHPQAQAVFNDRVLRAAAGNHSHLARLANREARPTEFHTHSGIYAGTLPSMPLDEERMNRIFRTMVRGLHFYHHRESLPANYDYDLIRYHPPDFNEVVALFQQRCALQGPIIRGQVTEHWYGALPNETSVTVWFMRFYESVGVSVLVSPPGRVGSQVPTRRFGHR